MSSNRYEGTVNSVVELNLVDLPMCSWKKTPAVVFKLNIWCFLSICASGMRRNRSLIVGLCHVMSCHVAVPSSTTLATMRCQSPLSSEALMSCVGLTLSFNESHRLSRYFSLLFSRPIRWLNVLTDVHSLYVIYVLGLYNNIMLSFSGPA